MGLTSLLAYERTEGQPLHIAGLAPEEFHTDPSNYSSILTTSATNGLAGHAMKSLWYMWRVSKEPRYREMGWSIFQSLLRHSRTQQGAFASIQVDLVPLEFE